MKKIIFTFDDGTIYDRHLIQLFRNHSLTATFNLNSGLDGYVWYLGDRPIERLVLKNNVELYKGFEIASHSLTHPHLSQCSDEELFRQVNDDKENLEKLFGEQIVSFAIPFDDYDERLIPLLKQLGFVCFRIDQPRYDYSKIDNPFQVGDNAISFETDWMDKAKEFLSSKQKDGTFIFAGHSYDFETKGTWEQFDDLLTLVEESPNVEAVQMRSLFCKP